MPLSAAEATYVHYTDKDIPLVISADGIELLRVNLDGSVTCNPDAPAEAWALNAAHLTRGPGREGAVQGR